MRLLIVLLLGVVAVSTVGAQKGEDDDCGFDVLTCSGFAERGRLAPISGNNAAKEQEAVDELIALNLLDAISQGDDSSLNENSRGLFKKIKKKVNKMFKGIKKFFKPKKCCKRFFGKKKCKKCGPKRPSTTPPPDYPEEPQDYVNPEPTNEQAEEPESVNVPEDPQGDFNDGDVAPESARHYSQNYPQYFD